MLDSNFALEALVFLLQALDQAGVLKRQGSHARYGSEQVPYSDHSLAFYYERNCKFALMSCAHYVALAAGCAVDAIVSCMVADVMVNQAEASLHHWLNVTLAVGVVLVVLGIIASMLGGLRRSD